MQIFDVLIEEYIHHNFAVQSNWFSTELIQGLYNRILYLKETGQMHPAGVGRNFDYQRNTRVRGDLIAWLDETSDNAFEQEFLCKIQEFTNYLNSTCFTNIQELEFHYAYYEPGSFYHKHLDQFKNDRRRQFSFVLYLNEDWKPSDGGALRLFFQEYEVQVSPKSGRFVFFNSAKVFHEVQQTHRERMSIAGWLKNRS